MIHQDFPEIAQRAATHCDALLKRQSTPDDLALEFEQFGERAALALRPTVAQAWGDPAIQVRSCGIRTTAAGKLKDICGGLAAVSLHAFADERKLLMSIDGRALLEQLDRAFGGSGLVGEDLPAELPVSADLLAKRFEAQAAATLTAELGGIEFRADQRGDLTALRPYAAKAELAVLTLELCGAGGRTWQLVLAVEAEHLSALLPRRSCAQSLNPKRKSTMSQAPFSDLPLSANATLVDMTVPLHRLAALAPGVVLPIMVARSVPLQVGEITIARGTIGQVDEQVALQITQILSGKDSQ